MMKNESLDTLEMKRSIQLGIYEETKDMTDEQLLTYFHNRARIGRFGKYFSRLDQSGPPMGVNLMDEH